MSGPKVSTDKRTTKDNPAFVAHVMLLMAEVCERKGMHGEADLLTLSAGRLVERHGQFPGGVLITIEAQENVMRAVVATLNAEKARLAKAVRPRTEVM